MRMPTFSIARIAPLAAILLLASSPAPEGNRENGWWRVYFANPGASASRRNDNSPDAAFKRLIGHASRSVYGAFYDISDETIAARLLEAHRRGIDVRIVTERDNAQKAPLRSLVNAGIPVVTDNGPGLMHNKFAVVDGAFVWTGSYNLTLNGAMKNDNNAIAIYSPELAEIFTAEFMEMHRDGVFGNRREFGAFAALTKKYHVRIGNTDVNAYFSPDDNVERIILKRLTKARRSVRFMAFSFTSKPLGEELVRLHKNGLDVGGVMEKTGTNSRDSQFVKFKIEGIPVRIISGIGRMHHKVMIIDESIVITGSFNYSRGANLRNDENILIIHNEEIARVYMEEFTRLYESKGGAAPSGRKLMRP
ncbi:MAG TPA: phospholipase D-like domain-containing protein [Spirochaetota bacterium]|nr:phospholipase D-like domain-containing protein [Spirochaetota bacterium]HNU91963.1 phospholipase D-like domain-containing protein [Spirochaetota bacterium]